ncbi:MULTISPECIES: DUF397 domain-containing protein [unclassified Streptomyces]|uniref:DUF397 domain-containing protein n=1 Tax=unclassified Streptomyces TaxID=2593676 RepID=UPI002DDB826E|nr:MULTISPECIES: DUF397 domain-containing protein [unclassified Streptomyces]WSA92716.1 DUF397 domain-containing protein [Streptomyces sp. NBC_01795]WSB77087.1 DUF397 domain-containing protein [Streptomyces sp. NBC_01775]WSS14646.1 DUF397 domain-containing protein [Streptomyces sp. NBC_01186]WSS43460.1 DUF397 domain-containing protein [Streptomyces sp. NBC_01187]
MTAPLWIRSSYCDSAGLDCVEVASCDTPAPLVWVRDTKSPRDPLLAVAPQAWSEFVSDIARLSNTSSWLPRST